MLRLTLAASKGSPELLLPQRQLLRSTEHALAQNAPGDDGDPVGLSHGQDLVLEVPRESIPEALVNDEWREVIGQDMLVAGRDEPGRAVACS